MSQTTVNHPAPDSPTAFMDDLQDAIQDLQPAQVSPDASMDIPPDSIPKPTPFYSDETILTELQDAIQDFSTPQLNSEERKGTLFESMFKTTPSCPAKIAWDIVNATQDHQPPRTSLERHMDISSDSASSITSHLSLEDHRLGQGFALTESSTCTHNHLITSRETDSCPKTTPPPPHQKVPMIKEGPPTNTGASRQDPQASLLPDQSSRTSTETSRTDELDEDYLLSQDMDTLHHPEDISMTGRSTKELPGSAFLPSPENFEKAVSPPSTKQANPESLPLFLPVRLGLCWKCGRPGHQRDSCQAKPIIFCSACGKVGVLSVRCICRHLFPAAAPQSRRQFPVITGIPCRKSGQYRCPTCGCPNAVKPRPCYQSRSRCRPKSTPSEAISRNY